MKPTYVPTTMDMAFLSNIPDFIYTVISNVLPKNPTLDPLTPFYFYKMGRLPQWLVKWFIKSQNKRRLANHTLFFRAMHHIETVRGYCHEVEEVVVVEDPKAISEILSNATHFMAEEDEEEEEEKERRPKHESEAALQKRIEDRLIVDNDNGLSLEIRDIPEKGRGIFATQDFSKGDFIVEYAGDLINLKEAKEREGEYSMDLSKGCYMYYFKANNKQYCIDATKETGRLGRLVNHSRLAPNLQTKVVLFRETPRLILIAKRDVKAGEELLYDYGDRSKKSLEAHPWLAC